MRGRATSGGHDVHQLPLPAPGHETVIRFVLSGPIVTGEAAAEAGRPAGPPDDVEGLRERVTALEQLLTEAQARMDALARALAATVTGGAQQAEALLAAPPRPRPVPATAAAGALTSVPPPAASSDRIPLAVAPSYDPAAVAPDEPGSADSEIPAHPKARGLRRMISVLKHD